MKYGNKKITTEDGTFDSKREYERWCELKLLSRAGSITNLRRQVPFELIPQQRDGKKTILPCRYIADFVYSDNGNMVVEDAKGMQTEVYRIKKKLMLERYGISVREV